MKPASLKRDFTLLLRAALRMNCPLLIGSLGLAGDVPHLAFMLELIREIFEEENARGLRVAVVDGHVDSGLLIGRLDELRPLGSMPALAEDDVRNSRPVAQMGIAPYITALDAGAQIVLCGRSCDVSIFAADPVRRGIDPGLAFQAAHILGGRTPSRRGRLRKRSACRKTASWEHSVPTRASPSRSPAAGTGSPARPAAPTSSAPSSR